MRSNTADVFFLTEEQKQRSVSPTFSHGDYLPGVTREQSLFSALTLHFKRLGCL